MPTSLRRTREDTSIHERLETLAQAIRDRDVDAVMVHYAPDVIVFDVMPPLDVQTAADYRKNFERWFSSMLGPIDYEMNGLRISMSDSHAFCHFVAHVIATRKTGEKADYWVRVTTCMQKANGQWLIAHEHVSVPATMQDT
jgi:ketosteroid isomerase-like protein